MRVLTFLLALLCAAVPLSAAFAWGDGGHRIICEIAYRELKPQIKARVDALVAIDPKYRTFADACTAADHPRLRGAEHYVNIPRTANRIDPAKPCPLADRCVISAVLNDTRDFALGLDVIDQLRLLKSLGHWVGDIHQPLHVSFEDDRGGNNVAIVGQCRFNLHAVWDNCIIESKIGTNYLSVAEQLRASITEQERAQWIPAEVSVESVVGWANETFAITQSPNVHYCIQKEGACWYAMDQQQYRGGDQRTVDVDDAYLSAQAMPTTEQLKKAGVRLGAILNTALMP